MPPSPVRGPSPRSERAGERSVTCGFCGRAFREDRGQPACRSCPLGDACRSVRCPWCGYENAARPGWLDRLASLLGAEEEAS